MSVIVRLGQSQKKTQFFETGGESLDTLTITPNRQITDIYQVLRHHFHHAENVEHIG